MPDRGRPERTRSVPHTPCWLPGYGIVCRCGWLAEAGADEHDQLKEHDRHRAAERTRRGDG